MSASTVESLCTDDSSGKQQSAKDNSVSSESFTGFLSNAISQMIYLRHTVYNVMYTRASYHFLYLFISKSETF